jgi:hypothetical protein
LHKNSDTAQPGSSSMTITLRVEDNFENPEFVIYNIFMHQ